MANYFKDYGPGYPVTEVSTVKNGDGTTTRVAKIEGVKVNFDFPGDANTEVLADVTFEFTIPSGVDPTNLYNQGPLKYQQVYYVGAWMGELDVPEEFQ